MSSIDNRVVKMGFDNAEFEQKAGTTINTLARLRQALTFDGIAKGVSEIQNKIGSLNFDGMANSLDSLNNRFSVLGEFAHNVFMDIVNSAAEAGQAIVNNLLLTPMKDGFSEYELQMNSIQTIMAGTGASVEEINKYLNDLNDYADKTIYSFSDMTENIGKFTNAGVSLSSATNAIKGVSNVAAIAGANTQQASHAMYNFAQALSSGSVRLQDWRSIELANLATVEFKQALIDTGVAMGTLVKEGDLYKTNTTDLKGKVSDAFDATNNFNNSLAHQWMTTDVLVQTLENYSNDIRDMTEDERLLYEEKLRGIGYTEDQIAVIEELGIKAANSAKDVKTFKQLIDTLKEALGTGWAQSWQLIIGDFEDAKELLTGVSEVLTGYIQASSDARNAVLQGWADGGGRTATIEALKNAFGALGDVVSPLQEAFKEIFPAVTADQLIDFSNNLKDFTESLRLTEGQMAAIRETSTQFFDILKDGFSIITTVGGSALDILGAFGRGLAEAFNKDLPENIRNAFSWIQNFGSNQNFINTFGSGLLANIKSFTESIKSFVESLKPSEQVLSNFQRLVTGVVSILRSLANVAINAGRALFDSLTGAIRNAAPEFSKFMDTVGKIGDKLTDFASKIESNFTYETFKGGISEIGDALSNLFDIIKSNVDIPGILTSMINFITGIDLSGIKGFFNGIIDGAKGISDIIHNVFTQLGGENGLFSWLANGFKSLISGIDWNSLFSVFAHIENFISAKLMINFLKWLEKLPDTMGKVAKSIAEVLNVAKPQGDTFVKLLKSIQDVFESWQSTIKAMTIMEIAASLALIGDALLKVSQIPSEKILSSFVYLAGGIAILAESAKLISGANITKIPDFTMFAFAIDTLARTLERLSGLDPIKMASGLGGTILLIGSLSASMEYLAKATKGIKAKDFISFGASMMLIAAAVDMLSFAVKKFAKLNPAGLAAGLSGVVILIGSLSAALDYLARIDTSKSGNIAAMCASMILIATAVDILSIAVKKMAKLDLPGLVAGLSGVIILLGSLAAAIDYLAKVDVQGGAGKIAALSASMILIAVAVDLLASGVKKLAGLDMAGLIGGLGGVIILLGSLVASVEFLSNLNLSHGAGQIVALAASMVIIAAAVDLLSVSVSKLGAMDPNALVQGLMGVGVELGALVGVIAMFNSFGSENAAGILAASAAMIVMAGAIAILSSSVTKLGQLNLEQLATGLLGMIGALYSVVTALFMLGELNTAGIVAASAAMILMAGAVAILAPSLVMLSTMDLGGLVIALGALAGAFYIMTVASAAMAPGVVTILAFSAAIALLGIGLFTTVTAINAIAGVIADSGSQISAGLATILQVIIDNLPLIGELILTFLTTLWETIMSFIAEAIPSLLDTLTTVVTSVCEFITANAPTIINTLLQVLLELLNQIATFVPQMAEAGMQIIKGFLDAINNNIGSVVESALNIVINFINAVASKIGEVIDAAFKLIISFINGLADAIDANHGALFGAIGNLIRSIVEAIGEGIRDVVEKGKELIGEFISGLTSGDLIQRMANAGMDLINGFIAGIGEMGSAVWNKACEVANNAWSAITSTLGIHSPSRVARKGGIWFAQGFINGMRDMEHDVDRESALLVQSAVDAVNSFDDLECSPNFQPVMDLDNIQNGIDLADSMFSAIPRVLDIDGAISARNAKLNTTIDALNKDADYSSIVNEMGKLRSDLNTYSEMLSRMSIVMDSGVLVGQLTPNIDQMLGRRQMLAGRGVI